MKAVIMAGGEGTRLRPLTCSKPKPMVTVANKPVMEHIIELLSKHKITDIAVTLQYMPHIIRDYFGDGREKKVNLNYYIEETPLGTAGSVKNAEDFLDETFLVISGDALTDIDLDKAIEFHRKKGAIATLVLKKVDIPLDYGVVVTDSEGKITKFLEKPSWSEVFSDTVNTGIYILSPEIFNYFQKGKVFDFSRDLFPVLLKEGKPLYGYITEDYWCDIGDIKAYNQANMDVIGGSATVNIPYSQLKKGQWIGSNTKISKKARIIPPVVIGDNCVLEDNAIIGPNCLIGDNCTIGDSSTVKKSVILSGTSISKNCEIRGALICNKVTLREGIRIFENAVIGDLTIINKNACIKPEVKVWPEKAVEEETEVCTNIVWGSKIKRNIFGNRGIAGEINVDITPAFAAKISEAFGAYIKMGGKVGIAFDGELASKALKSSMTAGLMSVGVNVLDFNDTILPDFRSSVKREKLSGGIYISTFPLDARINVYFLDTQGLDIDKATERKIENLYFRDDFRRSKFNEIGSLDTGKTSVSLYAEELFKKLRIAKVGAKVVYYTPLDSSVQFIEAAFKKLGCTGERLDSVENQPETLQMLRKAVQKKNVDLAVLFYRDLDKFIILDKQGFEYRDDKLMLLVTTALLATNKVKNLVIPFNSSRVIDDMAANTRTKVFRTKNSSQELTRTILEHKDDTMELQLALNLDAIFALCFLIAAVKSLGISFEDFAARLPSTSIKRQEVFCNWNSKGKVIRELINHKDAIKECIEGVMFSSPNGRVIILPDGERPVCNIISEAANSEFAEELSAVYEEKVKRISKS